MNPVSVYMAGIKAVEWVRNGNGPIILEMKTYRYRGHSMSDPAKYRSREEVQKIREEQDPIESIKIKLLERKIYNEEELNNIDTKIRKKISIKADNAINASDSDKTSLFQDVLKKG